MLRSTTAALAHQREALAPHEVWGAWNNDPLLLLGITAAALLYLRGWSRGNRWQEDWRQPLGSLGLAALALALLSPLDALANTLASAHMVQHILLILVAGPLLVAGGAPATMMRGLSPSLRRAARRAARASGADSVVHTLRRPVPAWVLHAGALWLWHSASLYEAALGSHSLHGLEHLAFIVTALLFWSAVLSPRASRRASRGVALLLVFTMALQGVLLSALLTFAPTPWYDVYADTTQAWGLAPLVDQQLAGVTMWVPGGLIYLGIGLALLAAWFRESAATPRPRLDDAAARSAPFS
ncbi:MAG TPA: cytochrome c oxidase assembly protein [Acidimicrobiales bacterium]|nr:cytochrome c oxidase assembly protein [Acidimicrobiales bacterium]